MPIFKRRRRVDLGTFVDPEEVEPAPVEQVVHEGLLIAASAVRMSLKNRIIVRALRDAADFDSEELAEFAAAEFTLLAARNDDSAARVWRDREWDDEPQDAVQAKRYRSIFTNLAEELRVAGANRDELLALVTGARDDALAEVLATRQPSVFRPPDLAEYERGKPARLSLLLDVDLKKLSDTASGLADEY